MSELNKRWGIETFADLAKRVGGMILCNAMAGEVELYSGRYDPETEEIYQWFIIEDPYILVNYTDERVFYHDGYDLFLWGITHFGTRWESVPAPSLALHDPVLTWRSGRGVVARSSCDGVVNPV